MAAPNILCDCTGMPRERWLECRAHGPKGDIEYTVGGSDVAIIFGLSPWTTPLELWLMKKGRLKAKSPPNPDQLEMGHMMEPIAAHFYQQRTGNLVTDDNHLYQHALFPYALANIDRRYMGDLDDEINKQQKEMGFTFAEEQRHAIQTALTTPFCIISGGPGTGKTSIQRAILNIYMNAFPDSRVVCCAPTGRAARRMEQSTGYPASTIHKVLNLTAGEIHELKEMEMLEADLVLVDEVSMMDMVTTWCLFNALPPRCRLILVGDADQLPSVGPGAVLNELLSCGQVPAVILDKVFRQSEGSLVAENAQRIRHGISDLEFGDDFQFWASADDAQSAKLLMHLYRREVDRFGVDNVALLTPFRKKSETGVYSLNAALHNIINPASKGKAEIEVGHRIFRVGDKVMQMKNRDFASNGDIGYICTSTRDDDGFLVEVDFGDDRVVAYENVDTLCQLELAYANTIHKSQGSEYDAVLINIQNMHGKMLNRALFYTAETRAKKHVIIVGDWEAVVRAIQTMDIKRRHTMLAMRINSLTKE